jgi:EpsI family protein
MALAVVVVLGGAGEGLRLSRPRTADYHPSFAAVPQQIGAYQGQDLPVDQSIYRFLSASGMLERVYVGPGEPVQLTVLYAADWRSVHSPTGCYPASGWEILEEQSVDFAVPAGGEALHTRLLRVRRGDRERLALFSFAYPGGTTADWSTMGVKVALGPRGAGGLVFTLSTDLGGDYEAALKRLDLILATAYPPAIAFWTTS